jgi:hypothetical protein
MELKRCIANDFVFLCLDFLYSSVREPSQCAMRPEHSFVTALTVAKFKMANNVLVQEAALVDPNRGTDPKET